MRSIERTIGLVNWRYAVGELLLIVAGITIAFSLNAWRERISSDATEGKFLMVYVWISNRL